MGGGGGGGAGLWWVADFQWSKFENDSNLTGFLLIAAKFPEGKEYYSWKTILLKLVFFIKRLVRIKEIAELKKANQTYDSLCIDFFLKGWVFSFGIEIFLLLKKKQQ